ncbi:MAG: HD-GYP domain-containing protein [Chloroflexi bacterium]|nr:MAG: HD-GYP domain-containing protein [Chloroflexota bacterium]
MTSPASSPTTTPSDGHLLRRVLRGLNSPLRIRVYLAAIVSAIAIATIWLAGAGTSDAERDVAAREFQASTSAAAASVAVRVAAVQESLGAADVLMAAGVAPNGICTPMSQAPNQPYQRLFVFASTGSTLCTSVPDAVDQADVMRQRVDFHLALTTGEDQVGAPALSPFTGRMALMFQHPLRANGRTLGVVTGALDATDLAQLARSDVYSKRMVIVGRGGETFELGAQGVSSLPDSVNSAVARSQTTGEPCPVVSVEEIAWTCSPVGSSGLAIAAGHPAASIFSVALDSTTQRRYRTVGVIVISIVAAMAIDFLFVQRVRRVYVSSGLTQMSVGDTASRDELDVLDGWVRMTNDTVHQLQLESETRHLSGRNSDRELLTSIAEIVEIRYPFLRNHGDRVGRYARQIGARLAIRGLELDLLEFAARVHDVGKIAIADAVYLKRGRLEPIETAQMQLHAARGGEFAGRLSSVPPGVADAIRHHHERWDGTGYPDGLAGTEIPLWSRVIAVADAYDAMTEERPYRAAPRTHDEAMAILEDGAGSQWDTTAVHAFLEVIKSSGVPSKVIPMPIRRLGSIA